MIILCFIILPDIILSMILPSQNKHLAQKRLKQLPQNDPSCRYYKGQKYTSSFLNRLAIFFNIGGYLKELEAFYPYQRAIKATVDQYFYEKTKCFKDSLLVSFICCFGVFQMGKKGYVMPVYSKYGKIFGTHRIFRHYTSALFLPYILMISWLNWKYLNHTQNFWAIHARRLNNKMTQDPKDTLYPSEMKSRNLSGVWRPNFIDPTDLETKWKNQQNFIDAPDFQVFQISVQIPSEYQQEEEFQQRTQKIGMNFEEQQLTYRDALRLAGIENQNQIPQSYLDKLDNKLGGDDTELLILLKLIKTQKSQE